MGARWEVAGNRADVVVFPESLHGFIAFPNEIGRIAVAHGIDFVRGAVSGEG